MLPNTKVALNWYQNTLLMKVHSLNTISYWSLKATTIWLYPGSPFGKWPIWGGGSTFAQKWTRAMSLLLWCIAANWQLCDDQIRDPNFTFSGKLWPKSNGSEGRPGNRPLWAGRGILLIFVQMIAVHSWKKNVWSKKKSEKWISSITKKSSKTKIQFIWNLLPVLLLFFKLAPTGAPIHITIRMSCWLFHSARCIQNQNQLKA